MKNLIYLICLTIFFVFVSYADEPIALINPTKLEKHGDTRIDNYFWMKNKNDEKVLNYLKQENEYTKNSMQNTLTLQEKLYLEMRKRVKEEDQSVPYKKGNYFYYTKYLKGEEYPIHYRKKIGSNSNENQEELLLNVNLLAKDKDYTNVSHLNIHPNEDLMSFAVDTKGDRLFTIYFKDLKNNKILENKIENVTDIQVWANKSRVLFYVSPDPQTLRANKVFRYDLQTNTHTLVYEEKDEKFDVQAYKTLSQNYIVIGSFSTLSSELRFIKSDDVLNSFQLFLKREKNHEYSIDDDGEHFIVRTNFNAKNFRLMQADHKTYTNLTKKEWKNIIPHNPKQFIEEFIVLKDFIATKFRENGVTKIMVLKKGNSDPEFITFPEAAYVTDFNTNSEFDSNFIRYSFESLNRPYSIFEYSIKDRTSKLLKEDSVPTYNANEYLSKRVFATSRDGTKIPISILYKASNKLEGSNPILVYGYGSYGISSDPNFDSSIVSLIDRGFVYAIAHVRGGAEMGKAWYENGKLFKKKNSFYDFIDATQFLINNKYGSPQKVYANGASAGGLLMGAVINFRPDLFHGVIAEVPFVDVVTTMLDNTLPLTTGEYDEWGDPNNLKSYKYMLSYSPYDNVKPLDYPNLLVKTGLNDTQVSYWEPTKWVAKLRAMRTNKNKLLLLQTEMDVGHGGKSGRFEYLKAIAFNYAFLLKLEGIKE